LGLQSPVRIDFIDGDALRRDLTALARANSDTAKLRKLALAHIKTVFNDARAQVKARVDGGEMQGLAAAHALSALQDTLLQVLYDFATKHFYYAQNPTQAERIAIVATGGYGRGQMAPFSDVDLLFLRPYKETPWGESVIEFILHMLWDLGLKVGHAARSLAECSRLAKQDVTIRTALLEARFLWGDREIFDKMRKEFWAEADARSGQDFVQAKLAERNQRHMRQGESRYLVEPNIKEGKGGLRDLQTLYWIGKYIYHTDDTADLVGEVYTREELQTFQQAETFLWDVRVRLHYLVGRAEERLSFDIQPELTARMGFTGDNPRRAVEKFMRAYFLVAKDVGDLTRIFCAALEEQNRKPKPSLARLLPGFLKPRTGTEDFFVENGRLNAPPNAFKRDPVNLIRIFHTADAKSVDVHPAALRTITRSLDLIGETLRNDPEANRLFLEILTSRRDPERALRWMNEAGVLGRFIPAFDHAVGLMQFNMYHHFTVDEHLIRAVGNIAAIERGEMKHEHPLSTDVIKRIQSRAALYVATLLHDIGKGLPGDHSVVGASIAESLCPRLGLSPAETASVIFLVRDHLVMSDTAQKRDLSDPKTVRDFVAAVQSPEMLRLLLVLTVADIRAVGPGVFNGWKGQLLRELYYEAAAMSGGDAMPGRAARIEAAKMKLRERIADLPEAARERAVTRHYDPYWLAFDDDAYERQARLIAGAEAKGQLLSMTAESDVFRAVTEITIYTPDHPGLFSKLAGAVAVSGGSIVDAKAFTTTDGFALDVFSVQDAEGEAFGDPSRIARLRQTIEKTLSGETSPRRILAQRPARKKRVAAFKVQPRVGFDNEASTTATVVEVEGLDRQGFLYDVTQALFESGLSISSSIVATYGERAIDVFYVRDGFGHKITHPERLKSVEARLLKVLSEEALEGREPLQA
jgi:[protein-PII] uridylyltransferase